MGRLGSACDNGGLLPEAPWDNENAIREEIFGQDRFEQHAESLARAQSTSDRPRRRLDLRSRLKENEKVLVAAHREIEQAIADRHALTPAAEWLVNNSHVVEELIREVRRALPASYYRALPKLADGPFAGYPRIFGIAWAYVAHTDSRFDEQLLEAFIISYQRITHLSIGELWALPISIRLVLVENLRRSARRVVVSRTQRKEADALITPAADGALSVDADRLVSSLTNEQGALRQAFVVQVLQRMSDADDESHALSQRVRAALQAHGTTPEDVVAREHQTSGATNNTVRQIIRSMREMPDVDWSAFFERVSLVDAAFMRHGDYALMDFATRNAYRTVIETLARRSHLTEVEIAAHAVKMAHAASPGSKAAEPGFYLLGAGQAAFKTEIGFARVWRDLPLTVAQRGALGGYVGSIGVLTIAILGLPLLALAGQGVDAAVLALLTVGGLLPAAKLATAIVNQAVMSEIQPAILPGLELEDGIPADARTIVVIPTLIGDEASVDELVERLEIHHLSTQLDNVFFAVLSDWTDSAAERSERDDDLLGYARDGVDALNHIHGPMAGGEKRFAILHRSRTWNEGEGRWMGWERKRGKLHELNRLLRGATDTTFVRDVGGPARAPSDIRFVITLDSDTRLPRDATKRLIGKMLHPLNRPVFCKDRRRVVDGYGLLQPRVTPSLPTDQDASLFQRLFSTAGGIDPYAGAISDIYQDLFGEGSYTGKGIYDVDAFESAMAGRIPDNTVLSHDLLEGLYVRAGLATDIEVIEEFPSRYDVARSRDHRWTRGDWQLLPWIVGDGPTTEDLAGTSRAPGLPALGRWKLVDNLLRSLTPIAMFLALIGGWLLPFEAAIIWTAFIALTIGVPAFLSIAANLAGKSQETTMRSHVASLAADAGLAVAQSSIHLVLLADRAYAMADAILRTLYRMFAGRRHLLEWTTAAQAKAMSAATTRAYYARMSGGVALGAAALIIAVSYGSGGLWVAAPIALLWLAAPAIARSVSFRVVGVLRPVATEANRLALRSIGRATWIYFERFVTAEDNFLPPDNFQEHPRAVIAHRTSPTNIGLYLLSTVSAREFGWISDLDAANRLEETMRTLSRMERHRGHFYNWYDTRSAAVMEPRYISSVDSGNLAGHLIAIAQACRRWSAPDPAARRALEGMRDALRLVDDALPAHHAEAITLLRQIERLLPASADVRPSLGETPPSALPDAKPIDWEQVRTLAGDLADHLDHSVGNPGADTWAHALSRSAGSHALFAALDATQRRALQRRLDAIADTAEYLVEAMDFAFLVDPQRELLSIGYSVETGSLDESCYDLLASEARLASLVGIAKGDLQKRHWFRLGRSLLPVQGTSVLTSWSGSMFEYLMPDLVTLTPPHSLLGSSVRAAVRTHIRHGKDEGLPWGISESAYNARDLEFTYQYASFGVAELGLKRGLADNHVIAPYATALASMVAPNEAAQNFSALRAMGARGLFGFYEAIDVTPNRVPAGERFEIIRAYMAHHQGMTVVALANTVLDQQIARDFHRAPMIQATELLLQERAPRLVPKQAPRATLVRVRSDDDDDGATAIRRIGARTGVTPDCHILGNRRLRVMMTGAGSGYTAWDGLAVTRWAADPTLDDLGSFIYVRDRTTGAMWSMGQQPVGVVADSYAATFSEGLIQISRTDGTLRSVLDVVVSPEDDALCRRVTVSNSGKVARALEITSYDELVLGHLDSDSAHPAFSKMFVETEYDTDLGALFARRRRRGSGDRAMTAAQFVTGTGISPEIEFETDRGKFIGRNRTLASPRAVVSGLPLSQSSGTILDPIFALRQRVTVLPGKSVRLCFWTLVGAEKDTLVPLIDKYKDGGAYGRTATLAWTQGLVELRHMGVSADEAMLFQQLASVIAYASPELRGRQRAIRTGALGYPEIWAAGISGDLPICLAYIDEVGDLGLIRQLLHAYEYWRSKGLEIDLVIVNNRIASYQQELQQTLETLCQSVSSRHRLGRDNTKGAVFLLRADLLAERTLLALPAAARAVLNARRGSLAEQLARIEAMPYTERPTVRRFAPAEIADPPAAATQLEAFNGYGGFARDGREYVIVLNGSQTTPAPWVNVIANPTFGFLVSADGGGYTWSINSRERQITPWTNDPVINRPGEVFYVRDEETGEIWTPTAVPIRDYAAPYSVTHGTGYTRFHHASRGIELTLEVSVATDDPVKIARLTVKNVSGRSRRLSVTSYVEWVLGLSRRRAGPEVVTEYDGARRTIYARNPWHHFFADRVAFSAMLAPVSEWTADRRSFIGRNGALDNPAGLAPGALLNASAGAASDPCAALRTQLALAPGGETVVATLLGDAANKAEAEALVARYAAADPAAACARSVAAWDRVLGTLQVRTPDRALDIMVNTWLPYQTLACRVWGRAGFYQAGGAYGFRDQLQDAMSLLLARPDIARAHILRAASRQFVEGDVQHWWLEPSGHGIRTRISDSRLWLAYATAHYVRTTGDSGVLDEDVAFIAGPALQPHEHEVYLLPVVSDQTGSLYEHCARALDSSLARGENGLALMQGGDWNDGMNRVGVEGRGESVWLSWFLIACLTEMGPLAASRGDTTRQGAWQAHAASLKAAIEDTAWDGQWYRRATMDDGTWLGSSESSACRIDAIAQSWSVLSGVGDPKRSRMAMSAVQAQLIDEPARLSLLFSPPFDGGGPDAGYITGYPPGVRENGGQYTHAAAWNVIALAELGEGDAAGRLLSLLNPINNAATKSACSRYRVEPYVIAADVYSIGANRGRGGWTWYTGSAGWIYRAAVEHVLGIRKLVDTLSIRPTIPTTWDGFEVTYRHGDAVYEIRVRNPSGISRGVASARLDGVPLVVGDAFAVMVPLDTRAGRHVVEVTLGVADVAQVAE